MTQTNMLAETAAETAPKASREARDQELFDRIADQYCAKDLADQSSPARRHRLLQTIGKVPWDSSASVLEVGCGAGFAAAYLAGRYQTYVGLDYSPELIKCARHFNQNDQARFEVANIHDFHAPRPFDAIFMVGVLHHVRDPESVTERCFSLLRPGGWIAVNEPQPANPIVHAARLARKRLDRMYSDEQLEMNRAQLSGLLKGAGFTNCQTYGQGLLSTPFAEVALRPRWLSRPLSKAACAFDRLIERYMARQMQALTWNLVAVGQRP